MFINDPELLSGGGLDRPIAVHPAALVESMEVGAGTRVWAFAHIADGAVVGEDCNICDHTFIEAGAIVGNRVTLKCGVYLWNGNVIEDDVFIGPNVSMCNDPYPRSGAHLSEHPRTIIRRGASIGAGAIILPGIEIGAYAMIGAGAVVTRSIPAFALAYGNPARVRGRVDRQGRPIGSPPAPNAIRSRTAA